MTYRPIFPGRHISRGNKEPIDYSQYTKEDLLERIERSEKMCDISINLAKKRCDGLEAQNEKLRGTVLFLSFQLSQADETVTELETRIEEFQQEEESGKVYVINPCFDKYIHYGDKELANAIKNDQIESFNRCMSFIKEHHRKHCNGEHYGPHGENCFGVDFFINSQRKEEVEDSSIRDRMEKVVKEFRKEEDDVKLEEVVDQAPQPYLEYVKRMEEKVKAEQQE
jgi:hypothetical protein